MEFSFEELKELWQLGKDVEALGREGILTLTTEEIEAVVEERFPDRIDELGKKEQEPFTVLSISSGEELEGSFLGALVGERVKKVDFPVVYQLGEGAEHGVLINLKSISEVKNKLLGVLEKAAVKRFVSSGGKHDEKEVVEEHLVEVFRGTALTPFCGEIAEMVEAVVEPSVGSLGEEVLEGLDFTEVVEEVYRRLFVDFLEVAPEGTMEGYGKLQLLEGSVEALLTTLKPFSPLIEKVEFLCPGSSRVAVVDFPTTEGLTDWEDLGETAQFRQWQSAAQAILVHYENGTDQEWENLAVESSKWLGFSNKIAVRVEEIRSEEWDHFSARVFGKDNSSEEILEYLERGEARSGCGRDSSEIAEEVVKTFEILGKGVGEFPLARVEKREALRELAEGRSGVGSWYPELLFAYSVLVHSRELGNTFSPEFYRAIKEVAHTFFVTEKRREYATGDFESVCGITAEEVATLIEVAKARVAKPVDGVDTKKLKVNFFENSGLKELKLF